MRTTIGVAGIDALIEGGVPRGAGVLIAGEPGSGKSVCCMQFILSGIREGEPGVYATADHPNRVLEAASALGWDLRGAVDDEKHTSAFKGASASGARRFRNPCTLVSYTKSNCS